MKRISFLIFEFFIISFAFSSLNAATRYVTSAGSGTLSGTSWANATNDLQLAINNSASGDEIWVAAGTYYPSRMATALETVTQNNRFNAFVLKSGVKIYGGFAGNENLLSERNWTINNTILSGDLGVAGNSSDNAYMVVIAAGNLGSAELNGFTITAGNATFYNGISVNGVSIEQSKGGGIACYSSSPVLSNLIVSNCTAYYGGGVCIYGSSPTISNLTITGNSSFTGAGMLITSSSSPQIENIQIYNNLSTQGWGAGGGILSESSSAPVIKNALIYKNTCYGFGAGVYLNGGTMTLINSTIVYNTITGTGGNGGGAAIKVQSGTFHLQNSIIWGNTVDNITKNTDGTINYSYCLLEAGTVSGTQIVSITNPRFENVNSDNYRIQPWSPAVNSGNNSYNSSTTDLDDNARIYDSTIDLGAYECQSAPTSPVKSRIIFVKKNASGLNDGSSWTNAFTELSEALYESENSSTVAQIWVAAGTYIPTRLVGSGSNAGDKSFVLQKDVAIYGGFAGTESSLSQRNWVNNPTVLSGNSTMFHVVVSAGDAGTAVLDGFSITAGTGSTWGNNTINTYSISWSCGGGIYCHASSPALSNLKIYSNSCILNGAAVYCAANSAPTIINSAIYKNTASQNSGGVYSDNSNPVLINCTVVNNTGQFSGAGVNGTATVKNTIIWNNTIGGSPNNTNGSVTFNYSLVQNGTVSGTGIISNSDPLFIDSANDNYRLSATSPAKEIGNNSYVTEISTDLDKQNRIGQTTVDLGVYEYIGRLYVKKGSSGSGASWNDAYGELANAITAAKAANNSSPGTINEIWVTAGTYYPTDIPEWGGTRDQAFIMPSDVKIYGGFVGTETLESERDYDSNETILSGDLGTIGDNSDNAYHVVAYSGNAGAAELNGFTIKNGYGNDGAGKDFGTNQISRGYGGGIVLHTSSPVLQNLKISNCYTSIYGGGVSCISSSPTINNCQFFSNQAKQEGGGIYAEGSSSPIITNCKIYNNSIQDDWKNGGGFKCTGSGNSQIINCLFYGNVARASGGAISNDGGTITVVNSTIVYNSSTGTNGIGYGGGIFGDATIYIKNCILWGNTVNGSVNNAFGSGLSFTTSLVESNTATGIISNSNPLFANIATNDYSLTWYSPAINKGTNSANNLSTDLAGNTRIYGTGSIDLGAYEYQANVPTYAASANGVLYVKKGSTGGGTSWNDAIGELSEALYVTGFVTGVSEIWTAAGTYFPDIIAGSGSTSRDKSFNLLNNIKIYGSFAGTETSTTQRQISSNPSVLSGDLGVVGDISDNAYHVVTVSGGLGTASLDGFTITGGNANGSSSITINSNSLDRNIGGGIFTYNSSVPFKNLILTGNTATKGGGMYAYQNNATYDSLTVSSNTASDKGAGIYFYSGTFTLQNSSLLSNTAQVDGGGAYIYDWPNMTLKNLVVKSNTATTGRGGGLFIESANSHDYYNLLIAQNQAGTYGGGIYTERYPTYNNITVAHNQATTDGAGIYVNPAYNATLRNAIVWGNRKTNGTINNNVGSITYNYSLVQGATLNSNNVIKNTNPQFVDSVGGDFRLKYGSPAMNQGNNDYVSSVSTDLAGNSRVNYNTVDLGAYEYTQRNKWVGSVSTDGSVAQNWAEGIVLTDNDVLEFDPAAQRDLLLGTNLSVCYLRNQSSRVLNTNGHKLTLTGLVDQTSSITSSLAGSSVEFAGTANQSILSGMFTSDSICNLIINNAANVTLSGNLHLTNNITATSGRLDAFTNSPTVYYSGQLLDGVFTNDRVYNLTLYNTSGYSPASDIQVGNNLTVGRSSVLTINPGRLFTVSGSVANHNGIGGIVIKASTSEANGTFIFHNAANNPLNGTVEMYTKAYYDANGPVGYKYNWQYFGVPLRTIVADPTLAGSYVRRYNEAGLSYSDCWVSLNNASVLTSLTGYEITQKLPKTISFSGVLENRDFNQTLAYTSNAYFPGQHIISNPYAAAIDITQIGFTNMEQSVYIYNTGGNADWQQNYGTSGNSPGQYIVIPVNQAGVSGLPDRIPSMQGFMVKAYTGGGTINIPYSSTATKNTQIQRVRNQKAVVNNQSVTIIDVKGTYFSDRMWLITNPQCTHSFDNGYDGEKLIGTSENPQLYAQEPDGNYQVNTVDDLNNTSLSFHSGKDSTYTLTFTHQNQSAGFSELYLTDSMTGQTIDISQNGSSYVFKAIPGTVMHKRFQISTLGVISSIQNERNSGISIYSENNKIHILNKTTEAGEIFLYDNSGKQVGNYLFNTNSTTSITPGLKAGIYTLKASCSKLSIVKNIIIKD